MRNQTLFPFTAITGQNDLKRAIEIMIVNPKAGGLLIGGEKGTAKSTLVRGIKELVGNQKIIELPLNATEDMLFGSIDLEYAIAKGAKKFLPGILSKAGGNILYIDEINLLRQDLLTAVLDINAAGINNVERDGISFSHAVNFTVVGTMNPEEGVFPGHILDRFGMYAESKSEKDILARVQIMKNLLAYGADHQKFRNTYIKETETLRERINTAKALLQKLEPSEAMIQLAAQICAQAFCAGHRAEIYLLEAAKAIAALEARTYVLPRDVEEAAMFVLPHRMRKPPEQTPEPESSEDQENDDSDDQEEQEDNQNDSNQPQLPPPQDNDVGDEEKQDDQQSDKNEDSTDNSDNNDKNNENINNPSQDDKVEDIDYKFVLPKMIVDMGQDRNVRRGNGKRSNTRTDLKQGRYVRANMPNGKVEDLAFDATIRAAAPYQRIRAHKGCCALNINKEDLRQKVREKRIGNTFLFLVDASGSMGAQQRMRAVKGAIFCMLQEAYQKRDRVGMIAFRRQKADVLLPVTRSIDLAQKCLKDLPTGGKTPLTEGLSTALMTLSTMNKKDRELEPILILLTDGRANAVDDNDKDPIESALNMARKFNKVNITSVVIDTENDFIKLGVAKKVAAEMGANYFSLKQLSKDQILRIVRNTQS